MSNLMLEFSQSVSKLNKEKKYSDTLEVFKEKKGSFSDEEIANNEYLVSTIVTALRHTNKSDYAFKFLDHYKIEISETTNERILNAYGWLLLTKYKEENLNSSFDQKGEGLADDESGELEITSLPVSSDALKRIKKFIPIIIEVDDEFSYSVFARLFELVLKTESKKPKVDWQFINEFCDLVSPEKLKTDCRKFEMEKDSIGDKRTIEMASDLENWYAYKSKALFKLGKYQECSKLSKEALEALKNFHYSNDVWFARRIALSKKQLGNTKEAIKELQQILRKKKEWFIQKELAELYKEEGNIDGAFKLAIEAALSPSNLDFKLDLLILLGDLLKVKNQVDLAFKHYSLSKLIRLKGNRNIPHKLTVALENCGKPDMPLEKLDLTAIELKKYWQSQK